MLKIKWKKPKGGRVWENILEGWVGKEKHFLIEGNLYVTDLRPMKNVPWEHPKNYRIECNTNDKRDIAKQMAYEILNNINPEVYEANLEKQRVENEHTQKVMKDAQDFLDKLNKKKQ